MWNKDEIRGKADRMKGRAKQALGDLKNDERLRNEGTEDEAAGAVEETFGKGRRKIGEAVSDLGKKIGALSFAAALGFAATLSAQSTTTSTAQQRMDNKSGREITITGCLSKAGDGTYVLTNAREDKAATTTGATGTTAGTSGTTTSGTTTSGTTTSGATTAGTTTAAAGEKAMIWKLQGNDLDRHVGHKIQVTGRTDWKDAMDHSRPGTDTDPVTTANPPATTNPPTTTIGTSGTLTDELQRRATTTDANQPKVDVTSIKMIASSCS